MCEITILQASHIVENPSVQERMAIPSHDNHGLITLRMSHGTLSYNLGGALITKHLLNGIETPILTLVGESVGTHPRFVLYLELPRNALGHALHLDHLKGKALPLLPIRPDIPGLSRIWLPGSNDYHLVAGGYLECLEAEGSGPWNLNGRCEFVIDSELVEGTLKAHLTVLR